MGRRGGVEEEVEERGDGSKVKEKKDEKKK